MTEMCVSIQEF